MKNKKIRLHCDIVKEGGGVGCVYISQNKVIKSSTVVVLVLSLLYDLWMPEAKPNTICIFAAWSSLAPSFKVLCLKNEDSFLNGIITNQVIIRKHWDHLDAKLKKDKIFQEFKKVIWEDRKLNLSHKFPRERQHQISARTLSRLPRSSLQNILWRSDEGSIFLFTSDRIWDKNVI